MNAARCSTALAAVTAGVALCPGVCEAQMAVERIAPPRLPSTPLSKPEQPSRPSLGRARLFQQPIAPTWVHLAPLGRPNLAKEDIRPRYTPQAPIHQEAIVQRDPAPPKLPRTILGLPHSPKPVSRPPPISRGQNLLPPEPRFDSSIFVPPLQPPAAPVPPSVP